MKVFLGQMDVEKELSSWRFNGGNIKEKNFLVVFKFNGKLNVVMLAV